MTDQKQQQVSEILTVIVKYNRLAEYEQWLHPARNKTTKVHAKMVQAIKGILLKPTLSVDGKLIVEKGKVVV